jgi:tRNA pseudouridine38-40 synthase
VTTIRLLIAYDGTRFRGWAAQREPHVRTVQGELLAVLERVIGSSPRLSVAGRTDAGVHARGQVASFRTEASVDPDTIRSAVNGALGPEVVVRAAVRAPDGFDARFDASAREYRYVIDTAEVPDPFTSRFRWHRPGALSVPRMRRAAAPLVGEHDFASFCRRPAGERSTVRDLQVLSVAVGAILEARDRARAPQLAPARGLTLERVIYGRRAREPSCRP